MDSDLYNEIDENALTQRIRSSAGMTSFIAGRTGEELLSRLDLLTLDPKIIVDLGAADGALGNALIERYPSSEVRCVEPVPGRLEKLPKPRFWQRRRVSAISDQPLTQLNLEDQSADLILANLSMTRYATPDALIKEAARCLHPEGVFSFATLGPDTFAELREAWAFDDTPAEHVASFADMHDVGDALGRAGLREPVLDVEKLTITYHQLEKLWQDLNAAGARNVLANRRRTLTSKTRWQTFCQRLMPTTGPLNITVELVFGHAFGAHANRQKSSSVSEVRIAPGAIRKRQ
ncbi:MAG: methyltransferase domain-containing protein [Woeseiaceae bacterium]